VETRIDPATQDLQVTIPVSEGLLSRVLEIRFDDTVTFPESQLLDATELNVGRPFSMSNIRKAQTLLRDFYREEGYPDARIKSVMEWTPEGIRVSFQVEEGYRVRIGRVVIVGHHKTRDWVIRRELTFKEGDPLRTSELQRSQRRLFDLGIFRSADVRIESDSRGQEVQDVMVQVVEQADLDVNYGLRYNFKTTDEATAEASAEGVEGNIRARLVNGLGRGSNLTASAFIRGEGDLYRIAYQVPRFFNWRLPTQVYYEHEQDIRQEDLDIGIDQWNVSFQQTRRLEEGVSAFRDKLSLQWNVSFGRFVLVEGDTLRADDVSIEEAAFRSEYRTVLGVSLIEDRRDNIANPTRGRFANVTFQVAPGFLGSDTAYYRAYSQMFYFYPLQKDLIWASSYRLGLAAGSEEFLFIDNRFTAGGANSVRGFKQNTLGPFVDVDDVRVYLGGQAVVVMNQELRFPIYKSLHGGAYYDMGNVFARVKDVSLSDMRHSLGAGLRFVLPVGAIRLDWARVLNPQPEDRLNSLHFSFGYAF
jgi:outer membrane protein assembly complex protein YaeT